MLPRQRHKRLPKHLRHCPRPAAQQHRQPRRRRKPPLPNQAAAPRREDQRTMRTNPVKQKLKSGQASIGHMVFEFATTGIGRVVATTGADFVLYDMEHTGWGVETIRMLLAT